MALTSEELNYLIYRYLRESGFEHSAFSFGHESFVYKSSLDGSQIPPGSLISLVQKGIQFSEIESHVALDGTESICEEPFSAIKQHNCRIRQKRRIFDPYEPIDSDFGSLEVDQAIPLHSGNVNADGSEIQGLRKFATQLSFHGGIGSACKLVIGWSDGGLRIIEFKDKVEDFKGKKLGGGPQRFFSLIAEFNGIKVKSEEKEKPNETTEIVKTEPANESKSSGAASEDVTSSTSSVAVSSPNSSKRRKLDEPQMNEIDKENSVTALAWNSNGTEITSGHYNGSIKVWNLKGELIESHSHHSGPIAALKFSKSGKFLLSASVDGSVNVLNPSLSLVRRYLAHSGPVLDVDWNPNDRSFVSCGTDGNIFLCSAVAEETSEPIKFSSSHAGDVNSVKFDSAGVYVASGGDDRVVKVFNSTSGSLIHTFRDHVRPVLNVRWSLENEKFSTQPLMLASSAADSSVNLYSIGSNSGALLFTLTKHAHPVTSLEFQPGNALLVSASHDRVHFWSTADGSLVKTFRSEGDGGVNSLAWDSVGRRVAVCYSDGPAYLIDLQL